MDCMNCGSRLAPGVKFCPRCGTPAPASNPYAQGYAPPPPGEQMHSSFGGPQGAAPPPTRRKSRAGKILLIVFGILLLLGAGAVAAVYFGYKFVERTVRESEPYRVAVEELKRSPEAAENLGEIQETGFPLGAFQESADGTGNAAFTMSVKGTKASGRYESALVRQGGVWRVTNGILRMDDGRVVPLIVMADGATARPVARGTDEPPPRPGAAATVNAGVLDGKATAKPAPPYPAIARAARASGSVTVQVTVNEQGRVVEARAVSGHPLLQQAAVQAARQARFEPTRQSGTPVRVTGTLTYDFRLE
jgi:TonB family protein